MEWTLNGTTQTPKHLNGGLEPGDTLVFGLEVVSIPKRVLAWEINATATYEDDSIFGERLSAPKSSQLAPDNGLGAGWGIDGVDRLVFTDYGITWITVRVIGDRLCTKQPSKPMAMASISARPRIRILKQNDDFSFTYMATDSKEWKFSKHGLLVSVKIRTTYSVTMSMTRQDV